MQGNPTDLKQLCSISRTPEIEKVSMDMIFREVEKCFHFKPGAYKFFESDSSGTDSEDNECTDHGEVESNSEFLKNECSEKETPNSKTNKHESIFNYYDQGIERITCKSKKKEDIYVSQHKIRSHKTSKKAIYITTPKGARYLCPFCKKKFKSWGSGNGHVSKRHGGCKNKCGFCFYTTWNPDAFRKHEKKHVKF